MIPTALEIQIVEDHAAKQRRTARHRHDPRRRCRLQQRQQLQHQREMAQVVDAELQFNPSAVRPSGGTITPALQISRSSCWWSARSWAAAAVTEARSAKSRAATQPKQWELRLDALDGLLSPPLITATQQYMGTLAGELKGCLKTIPVLAPVTRATRPACSAMASAVQGAIALQQPVVLANPCRPLTSFLLVS